MRTNKDHANQLRKIRDDDEMHGFSDTHLYIAALDAAIALLDPPELEHSVGYIKSLLQRAEDDLIRLQLKHVELVKAARHWVNMSDAVPATVEERNARWRVAQLLTESNK